MCSDSAHKDDSLKALEDPNYWGPSSSQADVMREQAGHPGMYRVTAPLSHDPVVFVEHLGPDIVEYRFENLPHDDSIQVILTILPKVLELYLRKSKDYGGLSGGLGPKAPFVDLWRKVIKLKRSLWDGHILKFEQNDEILMDLVGTCLNILAEMGPGEIRKPTSS